MVAASGGHEGQADAGVAAGGFDDQGVRREQATLLRVADHAVGDAVLDAAGGIVALHLEQDGCAGVTNHAMKANHFGASNEPSDVLGGVQVVQM